jgi:hypothetical protein
MATMDNEPWPEEQENELLRLASDDLYRHSRLGHFTTKWPPIAHHFGRTVKSVRRKYDSLVTYQSGQVPPSAFDGQMYTQMGGYYPQGMQPGQIMAPTGMMTYIPPGVSPEEFSAYIQQQQQQSYIYGFDPSQFVEANAQMHQMDQQQREAPRGKSKARAAPPKNDKVFWKDEEQAKLLRLVRSGKYRLEVLGNQAMDWDAIADHLGRGKRSVMRKYENIKNTKVSEDGTLLLPPNDGKKWSDEEVKELMKLADPDDPSYRKERFGITKVDWRKFGEHFGRSYESVAYKYSYSRNVVKNPAVAKKHMKAKHETSYKDMAISALQTLGGEGTSGQICNVIGLNPVFAPQLDLSVVSGKKTLKRWVHGIRSALNAFDMFEKTDIIFENEAVWRLDEAKVSEAARNSQKRSRQKSSAGGGKRKVPKRQKEQTSKDGQDSEEAGAQEVLAQMAKTKTLSEMNGAMAPVNENNAGERQSIAYVPIQNEASKLPLLQQILENPSATAEQLSMLPAEQLALLQQQIDQGNFNINMMPYMFQGDQNESNLPNPQHGMYDHHPYPAFEQQYDQQQYIEHLAAGHVDPSAAQQMAYFQNVPMGQSLGMQMQHMQQGYDYPMYNPYAPFPSQYPYDQQHQYGAPPGHYPGSGMMNMGGYQTHGSHPDQYDQR